MFSTNVVLLCKIFNTTSFSYKAIFLLLPDTYTYNTVIVIIQLKEFSPAKLNMYTDSDKQSSKHHLYVEN